jgi:putative endopeptidase
MDGWIAKVCVPVSLTHSNPSFTTSPDTATHIHNKGIDAFFRTGASPDNTNASHCLAQLSQGGLGLPDRDYYFDKEDDDENAQNKAATIRTAYESHIVNMLIFLGVEETAAMAQAAFCMSVETRLAAAHMTRTENRDPHACFNKMSLAEFSTQHAEGVFDFGAYMAGVIGQADAASALGEVNVRNVQALVAAGGVAAQLDADMLRAYLTWHVLHSLAPYLTQAVVAEDFAFFQTTLAGTKEMKPRWKRAMAFTEEALGEVLGQLYCERYFDESSKVRALTIVEAVRASLEERLQQVPWITAESTRAQALKKMDAFKVKIGYPSKWIDYSPLAITTDDSFLQMVLNARAFAHHREVKEMNAPTDRAKWVRESEQSQVSRFCLLPTARTYISLEALIFSFWSG